MTAFEWMLYRAGPKDRELLLGKHPPDGLLALDPVLIPRRFA